MPKLHLPVPRWTSIVAAAAVVALSGAPAHADSVRSAEWPLDSQHFQADKLWNISRGSGITVAIIDSGVSADHPDLQGQILPGASMLGDGGDGRTDTSGESHGTAIAGLIAGTGGPSGTGMVGLAPGAKILPVRVTQGTQVSPSVLAQGITWAVDHGAQVINVSMGAADPDPLLKQAVNYALRKNVVLVASAGNQGQTGNPPLYPAAFPGVVSVSGVSQDGTFWQPSESGKGITLAAPASDIYSANDQGQYVHADGTSYAAAYVSAAAALIRARWPELTAGQVIRRLISTTRSHHDKPDPRLGYGELDPLAALTVTSADADGTDNPLQHPAAPTPASQGQMTGLITAVGGIAALAGLAVLVIRQQRARRVARPEAAQPGETPARRGSTPRNPNPAPKSKRPTKRR